MFLIGVKEIKHLNAAHWEAKKQIARHMSLKAYLKSAAHERTNEISVERGENAQIHLAG